MTRYQGNAHLYSRQALPARSSTTADAEPGVNPVLAAIDPEFARRIQPGDILVAGENFGGRFAALEAVAALMEAGIMVVLAQSFDPAFIKSANRAGLPLFLVEDHRTEMDDPVTVDTEHALLINGITGHEAKIVPVEGSLD